MKNQMKSNWSERMDIMRGDIWVVSRICWENMDSNWKNRNDHKVYKLHYRLNWFRGQFQKEKIRLKLSWVC